MDNELLSEANSNSKMEEFIREILEKQMDKLKKNIEWKKRCLFDTQRRFKNTEYVIFSFIKGTFNSCSRSGAGLELF